MSTDIAYKDTGKYNCEYARLNCSCTGHGGCSVTCYLMYSHTEYNQTECYSADPSLFLKGFRSTEKDLTSPFKHKYIFYR